MLEVVEPGLLDTIEDLGRPGWGHLGVPASGAADRWSLRIANRIVGNAEDEAAIEITLAGPRLRVLEPVTVALAGADLGDGTSLARGRAVPMTEGDEIHLAGTGRTAAPGARAYLAVAGGIDVPVMLGSRSTCLAGGFGGLDGRPLRAGDRLRPRAEVNRDAVVQAWPDEPMAPRSVDPDGTTLIRVLPGPAATSLPQQLFRVQAASDRMALRLEPAIHSPGDHVISHPVVLGAIQLPPDGRPIVLMADHQPTGGYPVVGVVISADHPALGQLAPGAALRFEPVDLETARAALEEQRRTWAATLEIARADAGWDELWRSAGG